jgi:PilZ domain
LSKRFDHPLAALAPALVASEEAPDRRSEARYPTQDPAELEVLPGAAGPVRLAEPIYGTVLDVSRSGLRIALARRLRRGERVKVKLHHNVILGDVRYCRSVSGGFHAGIRIQDLMRPAGREQQHIADDPLSFYAVGKGLTVPEVIDVREHLGRCETCRARLAEKEALLNPSRKRRPDRLK